MQPLRQRSLRLTGYLEELLHKSKWWTPPDVVGKTELEQKDKAESDSSAQHQQKYGFTIITPSDPASRGSQLSLVFTPLGGKTMPKVLKGLEAHGVIGDSRKPDVIRLAPCALYSTFEDVERAAEILEKVMGDLGKDDM